MADIAFVLSDSYTVSDAAPARFISIVAGGADTFSFLDGAPTSSLVRSFGTFHADIFHQDVSPLTGTSDVSTSFGIRFKSDVAGTITGIRVFTPAVSGVIDVALYNDSGTQLAEQASGFGGGPGWGLVPFLSGSVAITAGAFYRAVVSFTSYIQATQLDGNNFSYPYSIGPYTVTAAYIQADGGVISFPTTTTSKIVGVDIAGSSFFQIPGPSETLALSDSISVLHDNGFFFSLGDTLSLSDVIPPFLRPSADSLFLRDSVAVSSGYPFRITLDSFWLGDAVVGTVIGQILKSGDALALSDVVAGNAPPRISADTNTLSDAATFTLASTFLDLFDGVSDSLILSDALNRGGQALNPYLTETVQLSDSVAVLLGADPLGYLRRYLNDVN